MAHAHHGRVQGTSGENPTHRFRQHLDPAGPDRQHDNTPAGRLLSTKQHKPNSLFVLHVPHIEYNGRLSLPGRCCHESIPVRQLFCQQRLLPHPSRQGQTQVGTDGRGNQGRARDGGPGPERHVGQLQLGCRHAEGQGRVHSLRRDVPQADVHEGQLSPRRSIHRPGHADHAGQSRLDAAFKGQHGGANRKMYVGARGRRLPRDRSQRQQHLPALYRLPRRSVALLPRRAGLLSDIRRRIWHGIEHR